MAQPVQVWLLYRGASVQHPEVLTEQLHDQHLVGLSRNWWGRLTAALLRRFRYRIPKVVPKALPLREPHRDIAAQTAAELQRLLGDAVRCKAIFHYGSGNLDSRLRSLPQHSTVLLCPMEPFRRGLLYSMLSSARAALADHRCSELPPLSQLDSWIGYCLEQIRMGLAECHHANIDGAYSLIYVLGEDAKEWNQPGEELQLAMDEFNQRLTAALPSAVDIQVVLRAEQVSFVTSAAAFVLWGYLGWEESIEPPSALLDLNRPLRRLPALEPKLIGKLKSTIFLSLDALLDAELSEQSSEEVVQ